MWDLEIIKKLSKYKNLETKILLIGYTNNDEINWLINNILINKNSELFILDTWNLIDTNINMLNPFDMKNEDLKNKNKFVRELKKIDQNEKIIVLKKTLENSFLIFDEKNINFDIILIDCKLISNVMNILIYSLKYINNNGFIILSNFENNKIIIDSFINIFNSEIIFDKKNNFITISKNENKNFTTELPIYINKLLDKYLKINNFFININLPKNNIKKINWKFEINDNYKYNSSLLNYKYEIEKYNNYIYDISNTKFEELKNLDINYFLVVRKEEFSKLESLIKKKFITKNSDKNFEDLKNKMKISKDFNYKLEKLFIDYSKLNQKNDKILYFSSSEKIKKTELISFFYKKKNIKKLNFTMFNLFSFDSIIKNINKENTKYDLIHINLLRYLNKNKLHNSYKYYSNYLLLNLLYLILNLQNKNGEFYLIMPPITNFVELQILYIIQFYYKNVYIKTYFNYTNYYSIVIHASKYKHISTKELEDFYINYNSFYQNYIKSHDQEILLGNRINGLYLDNIISNNINKNLIQIIKNFNKNYYKDFLENLRMKIDIYDFLNNSSTTKAQKDYIYDKLFQYQYKKYLENFNKIFKK